VLAALREATEFTAAATSQEASYHNINKEMKKTKKTKKTLLNNWLKELKCAESDTSMDEVDVSEGPGVHNLPHRSGSASPGAPLCDYSEEGPHDPNIWCDGCGVVRSWTARWSET
jgi:hypothetical protein